MPNQQVPEELDRAADAFESVLLSMSYLVLLEGVENDPKHADVAFTEDTKIELIKFAAETLLVVANAYELHFPDSFLEEIKPGAKFSREDLSDYLKKCGGTVLKVAAREMHHLVEQQGAPYPVDVLLVDPPAFGTDLAQWCEAAVPVFTALRKAENVTSDTLSGSFCAPNFFLYVNASEAQKQFGRMLDPNAWDFVNNAPQSFGLDF